MVKLTDQVARISQPLSAPGKTSRETSHDYTSSESDNFSPRLKSARRRDKSEKDDDILELEADNDLDEESLAILGKVPNSEQKFGPPIHKDLAARWEPYAGKGVENKEINALLEQYLLPENSFKIASPVLNPGIKLASPPFAVERDQQFSDMQKQLATGITALGHGITCMMKNQKTEDSFKQMFTDFSNSGKLLLDLQYKLSLRRKQLLLANVKSPVLKNQIGETSIDTLLFGEDLQSRVKSAEDMEKLSKNLVKSSPATKAPSASSKPRSSVSIVKKTSTGSKNYRGPLRSRTANKSGRSYPYQNDRRRRQ